MEKTERIEKTETPERAETTIPVVIADDDAGMRAVMRKMIERVEGVKLVGEAQDGRELLAQVEQKRPKLVFLDVEMPQMSGVEAARIIQDTDPSVILVFATAHDRYMADAFEVYAFDYLVKPFKLERVLKTLERARDVLLRRTQEEPVPNPTQKAVPRARATAGRLMLRHREGVNFVAMEDILVVQRENRATVLYMKGGVRFVTSESLGDIEARLDPEIFYRCHKSYIINLREIDSITPYGRWTYVVRLCGTQQDALITHERYEELERMFS